MFQLANPWILVCLPLPWLIRYLLPPANVSGGEALRVPFLGRLEQLIMAQENKLSFAMSQWKRLSFYLIWLLLVIAAARPEWLGEPIAQPRSGRALMLAVDLSGSMQTPDMTLLGMQADRLTVVKEVAKKFIEQRKGDRLGLILFGSRAYLQTPLTFDKQTVLHMLDDATIGLAGTETAIGDAIGLAVKRLRAYPKESRVLVLLTDGANNSGTVAPIQAARLAATEGIKIYTIGVGADSIMVPGPFGTQMVNPSSELDEDTLREIAELTGGMFFRAKNTEALAQAYTMLDQLEPVLADQVVYRTIKPLYPWPLATALLLSMGLVWRRINRGRAYAG